MSEAPRTITVFTHKYPEQTSAALRRLLEVAGEAGVEVWLTTDEVEKHGLRGGRGFKVVDAVDGGTDLAVVLGGDGTILGALRAYAGHKAPVFAVNFGTIGFLSTVDSRDLDEGLRNAFGGEYDLLRMPALAVEVGGERRLGINDISFHRRVDERVAELEYSLGGARLGAVRCDGLVAATPVGSTGYNLANGGPVLAWGVEGFVVSFIAPHTLTARALVVGPSDTLTVRNASERDGVDMTTDGQIVGVLGPGEEIEISFIADQVLLAEMHGASFYRRFLDKFGRLAK